MLARLLLLAAEIGGVVRDPAGLPVQSADVELRGASTGAIQRTRSAGDGGYSFLSIANGEYRLTVSADGFRTLARVGVRVGPEPVTIDLQLTPGEKRERIEVTAEAPLLKSSRGTVSFAVEQRKVVSLPLDGRNFVPLIAMVPGVSLPPGSTLPRINGSRPRVSEYLYDGISVLQPEPGQVAFFPVVDAIEEFRVETNSYSAEYGRANGGVILVTQKSGGNAFHGSLFEFFRHERLNGRNLFAPANQERPRFRRNQYGFVLGGPVERDRSFFFVDWQGTRLQTGAVRVSTVPTASERSGAFRSAIYDPLAGRVRFPGDVIPASRFDATAARILDRFPVPGSGTTANNYTRVGSERTSQDQFDTRFDRYFGARHRVFWRYSWVRDDSQPVTPLPDGSGTIASGVLGDSLTRAESIATEYSWTPAATRANQFRFGYTRRGFDRAPSVGTGVAAYDIAGLQLLGPPANSQADFTTSVTQVADTFTWTARGHIVRAGADVRHERLDVLQPPNPNGLYQFTSVLTASESLSGGSSLASFLLGQVQSYQMDVQNEVLRPRAWIGELFVQDDYKVTPRLAINLGVRYTLNIPSTVSGNRGAVFNLVTERLDFLGRDGNPRTARNLEWGNFGPRVGIAYRIAEAVVLRAGYGMTWIEQAGITTPFTTPLFPFIRSVQETSLDNRTAAFTLSQGPAPPSGEPDADSGLGAGVFAVQRDQKSGYAQQWNLSLQKTFRSIWSIEGGYLGSKLTNLGVPDVNMNQLPAELLTRGSELTQAVENPYFGQIPASSPLGRATIARQQLLRPYPRFGVVSLYRNNVGHSTYHSFQTRIERQFSRGLTFTGAYTFSRLIDDAGAVFDAALLTGPVTSFQAADSYNRRLEKDVSTGDIRHIASAGFVWEPRFAKGWQIAGIARAQSGSPLAVVQQTNLNSFAGFGIQRPNRLRDPRLDGEAQSTARWFDTSAFAAAPQFTLGSSSRNPVVGPGYRTLDVMAGRTFAMTERIRAEVRAEAFNVTNTPPLGNPNSTFGSPAFGTITTARDPRVFEVVMKVHF